MVKFTVGPLPKRDDPIFADGLKISSHVVSRRSTQSFTAPAAGRSDEPKTTAATKSRRPRRTEAA
jgi:hypothetical protein